MSEPLGMLVIDKPPGCTSHDVVLKVRRRLNCRAGHTGTLDPQATGVLLVCIGKATRLTRFLQHRDKVYEGTVRLGWATDTYDADGAQIGEVVPAPELTLAQVEGAVERFVGEIDQVPPVYSAKKIRGQPAYKRARRGEQVVHEPTRVTIHWIQVLEVGQGRIRLRVRCGPGTYLRTLAHDLGTALGCPSHLEALRRLSVAEFDLQGAILWDELLEAPPQDILARAMEPAEMLPSWAFVTLNEQGAQVLRNGGVIEPRYVIERGVGAGGAVVTGSGKAQWAKLLDPKHRMLAAAEVLPGGILQPRVVLG